MVLDADSYRLSDAEHEAIFDRDIKPELFANAIPSNRPIAVIFGGQPGAGKSAAVDAAMLDFEPHGGAIQIIGDDLRSYHPQYARLMEADDKTAAFYTDRDSGKWIEMAIAEAKARRVNIVIEGTMRDSNKVVDTMQSLRAAGYKIDARVLAVSELFSQQGIMQRYEKQKATRGTARMTTPEAHKAAFDGIPGTLERIERGKLADRVTIYRRGAEAICYNELQAGEWVQEPKAREILEAERRRPMTLQERRSYAEGFDRLAELLMRPERQASTTEIKSVNDLRLRAKLLDSVAEFRDGWVRVVNEKGLTLQETDLSKGDYRGPILDMDDVFAVQKTGRDTCIIHQLSDLDGRPTENNPKLRIQYKDGHGFVTGNLEPDHSPQMGW
jgi:predicted ABC-type ATPase